MTQQPSAKLKPVFSYLSAGCLLIGLILVFFIVTAFNHGETLSANNRLAISTSFLVALLLSGLITGQIGLIRGEKPVFLSVLALLMNALLFIAVIIQMPK